MTAQLARIVDCFSKRLQIQERLTQQIAEGVAETTGARGVAVIVECTHMCMTLRGVQKPGATTVTPFFTGTYAADAGLRTELYGILASSGMSASRAAAAADPGGLVDPASGHGAHGLGSPRFARGGPVVVSGGAALPAAGLDVGSSAEAFTISRVPG